MANPIESYEFQREGARSKYDKYLDGRIWRLLLGTDCPANHRYAGAQFHARARLAGGKIRIARDGDKHLVVQFYKSGVTKATP